MENLEEKLSTIYLVIGQTALQYLMNVPQFMAQRSRRKSEKSA
jgi:uncharacterized membrane protein YuzA (DUF378 family)